MSATASWIREHWLEELWAAFAVLNLLAILAVPSFETVPFHFIWVSLTFLYGFRVWRAGPTLGVFLCVFLATGITLALAVMQEARGADELAEVPLMGAMFLAMVWHAQRRQAALEQVRQAAEREHAFLRDAAHQLKTPVAVARAYADMARSSTDATEVKEDLGTLIGELERLGRLADRLLFLATSDKGRAGVQEQVDFEELIVSTVSRWSKAAERRWGVDVQAYGVLLADEQRLRETLDALMDNAVKATRPGDAISLVGWAEDMTAVIELFDAGCGIEPDALPRVLDRFWTRWPDGATAQSTGLGLPIAQAVVAAHNGTLEIRSDRSKGTTVTLRLPSFSPAAGMPERASLVVAHGAR